LIYSDGVTEAANPDEHLFEEHRLVGVLEGEEFAGPEMAVEAVMEAVVQFENGADQADDITLLGLLVHQDGSSAEVPVLQVSIPNVLAELDRVNDAFEAFAEEHEIAPMPVRQIMMSLDELLNNTISYGFQDEEDHEIEIRIELGSERLLVTLVDDGIPFNPFQMSTPDITLGVEEREIGGLGVHLVRSTMDEVSYKRRIDQNVVTLIKYLGMP
jgi:sigma-B regulation protein RsbU (phosphoserine phosphatase)